MGLPKLDIIPLKPAVRSDGAATLDVLIRITPAAARAAVKRPKLNLGLVLDRSGSMDTANKLPFAREAAVFAVQQLLPTDRVSVTVFDESIQTLVPNGVAESKARIIEAIRKIIPGGNTALHGGWQEGANQVGGALVANGLNRVILLSDGEANAGITDSDTIGTDVNKKAREGVSTTTIGLGDQYNEKLLEAMALSGDGNYYYVESAANLPAIFERELTELAGLSGNTVSLGIEPQSGVTVADAFNDLETLPTGRYKLPNLIADLPIYLVYRLNVPARATESEIVRIRLAWNEPEKTGRQELYATLRLSPVNAAIWDALQPDADVQQRVAILQIARLKKIASDRLRQGDRDAAGRGLADAHVLASALPHSAEMERELADLSCTVQQLEDRDDDKFHKYTHSQAHARRRSKPMPFNTDPLT